jgi:hypothetical protein
MNEENLTDAAKRAYRLVFPAWTMSSAEGLTLNGCTKALTIVWTDRFMPWCTCRLHPIFMNQLCSTWGIQNENEINDVMASAWRQRMAPPLQNPSFDRLYYIDAGSSDLILVVLRRLRRR